MPVDFVQLFSEEQWERLLRSSSKCPKTIAALLSLPRTARTALLRDACGGAGAGELAALEAVAHDLPLLEGSAVAFVDGAEVMSEGDVVTLRLAVRHANLFDEPAPAPTPAGAGVALPKPSGPAVPDVYAPLLPLSRAEEWHVWIEDSLTGRFLWGTNTVWKPTRGEETIEIKFQPVKAGLRKYKVNVRSSVYLGLDVVFETP